MHTWKKTAILMLVFALLVTMIPPLPKVEAITGAISLDNYTWPGTGEPKFETDKDDIRQIKRVTDKEITLSGNIQDLKEEDLRYLYYTVIQLDPTNGREVNRNVVQNNPAMIPEENGRLAQDRYQFNHVQLFEGVNKIVIRYEKEGTIQESKPGYVIFTAAPLIYDLKVEEIPIQDDRFYPERANMTDVISLHGKGNNLQEVLANRHGSSQTVKGSVDRYDGSFWISAGLNPRGAENILTLEPGDNRIYLIGRSVNGDIYRVQRNMIYNTGAFLFDAKLCDGTDKKELLMQPKIDYDSNVPAISLATKIKVDVIDEEGNLAYDRVRFLLNGEAYRVEKEKPTAPDKTDTEKIILEYNWIDLKTGELYINDPAQKDGLVTVSLSKVEKTSGGVTYYEYTIPESDLKLIEASASITQPQQELTVIFEKEQQDPLQRTYKFELFDKSSVYIERVLTDEGELHPEANLLTNAPLNFKVYVNDSTKDNLMVKMEVDGADKGSKKPVNGDISFENIELNEGEHHLKFIPVIGGEEKTVGAVEYIVSYRPTPYVIFKNIYEGKKYTEKDTFSSIEGVLVNISPEQKKKVKVTIGGETKLLEDVITNKSSDDYTKKNIFSIDVKKTFTEVQSKQGKVTITFDFFNQDDTPLSSTSISIYIFTTKMPEFTSLYPLDEHRTPHFIQGNRPYTYHTNEEKVTIKGEVRNVESLQAIVRKGSDKEEAEHYWYTGSQFIKTKQDTSFAMKERTSFELKDIDLALTGSTIIEFIAENEGITTIQIIEIVREPLVFHVVKPDISKSNVVTTNILKVQVKAEGADKVIYNKEEAVRLDEDDDGKLVSDLFEFYTKELKPNKLNKIKVDILRGEEKETGEFEVYYADKVVPGAQHWTKFSGTIKAMTGMVQIKVPKGTVLRRNDWDHTNYYLTPEREVVIAVADPADGKVERTDHYDRQGARVLREPTGRFYPISPLYWIDAGYITKPKHRDDEHGIEQTVFGHGTLPYDKDAKFYQRNVEDQMVPITDDGKQVMATFKYDENIVQSGWPYVTVYHFHEFEDHRGIKEKQWENVGGVVDPKKHTITVPIEEFGYYQVMYMRKSFNDVINHPWARNDLDLMYSKGYMVNGTDELFLPNEPVTRGEFATLLVKAFEIPLDYEGDASFSDVPRVDRSSRGLYDFKHIETAARAGIVRGGLEGQFFPNRPISREDAAVMIARAASMKLDSINRAKPRLEKDFTDAGKIDDYAAPAVSAVVKAGMMAGKPHAAKEGEKDSFYFEPKGQLTRAEAATIATNVLSNAKRIPKQK